MKHNEINENMLSNISDSIMSLLCTQINDFSNDDFGGVSLKKTGSDGLKELLTRAITLGINGKVVEGELLPYDFINLGIAQKLWEIENGNEQSDAIKLIENALYARVKLCFFDKIPMADIYDMNIAFETIESVHGHDLFLSELAALANMSERSVRNDLLSAPEDAVYKVAGETMRIKAEYAREWLKYRKDFKPTINLAWGKSDDDGLIQVPVAADGSVFSPACAYKKGGFTVGDKGDEIKVATFEEALEYLLSMPLARWRRPNKAGNYGIVSAVSWQRITRAELHK
ncbi:MAG: hypothetical protein ACI9YE_003288 [Psychroserpens sp.]|jgi:hypothetical protein